MGLVQTVLVMPMPVVVVMARAMLLMVVLRMMIRWAVRVMVLRCMDVMVVAIRRVELLLLEAGLLVRGHRVLEVVIVTSMRGVWISGRRRVVVVGGGGHGRVSGRRCPRHLIAWHRSTTHRPALISDHLTFQKRRPTAPPWSPLLELARRQSRLPRLNLCA